VAEEEAVAAEGVKGKAVSWERHSPDKVKQEGALRTDSPSLGGTFRQCPLYSVSARQKRETELAQTLVHAHLTSLVRHAQDYRQALQDKEREKQERESESEGMRGEGPSLPSGTGTGRRRLSLTNRTLSFSQSQSQSRGEWDFFDEDDSASIPENSPHQVFLLR
jgi:hypothetical protein